MYSILLLHLIFFEIIDAFSIIALLIENKLKGKYVLTLKRNKKDEFWCFTESGSLHTHESI